MIRKTVTFCFFSFFLPQTLLADQNAECQVITGAVTKYNPYGSKLLIAKEIEYQEDKKKLITSKTLPVPTKTTVKPFSVIDMIEKYTRVEKPIRYEGSDERYLETINIESRAEDNDHSLYSELQERRRSTLEKLLKMEEEAYSKHHKVCVTTRGRIKANSAGNKNRVVGTYKVVSGDSLSRIAEKFNMKTSELCEMNGIKKDDTLCVGTKLSIPMKQQMIDIISKAAYVVKPGDTLSSIAEDFNLSRKDLLTYNKLPDKKALRVGKKLMLPFPYKIAEIKREKKAKAQRAKEEKKRTRFAKTFGKRKLRVTATAYSSHCTQTDSTPFLAAWNNRIRPGMKIIAVSRDMLKTYGLKNGSKVRISGLRGLYTVRDKMNKRYKKRIDIYMGTNRRKALRWGRRSVVIYF